MNIICKSFKHPHNPVRMLRQPNEEHNGRRFAVWRCPVADCGQEKRQGLRGKDKNLIPSTNG